MAAAEGEAHRTAQMDRNAFHRALVTALSDPYTISGRATAEKLKALERVQGGREDSFVLDARYGLGRRDDAYLQAPVLPLQTWDDDHEPLGLRLVAPRLVGLRVEQRVLRRRVLAAEGRLEPHERRRERARRRD